MVKEVIVKDYGGVMSAREQDAFKAAFVVYVMSTLLVPGAKHDYAGVNYWNAIVDPSKISCYDWGDYVVHRLMDAVVKVKADIRKGIKACNITGCCLFLHVLYLDSMDLGVWNMEPKFFPRIRCFSADRIRSMILADTLFPGDSYRLPEFGKSQLRKADGVPYVWARMRSEQFKLASAWEAAICVSRTLLVPMELLKVIPSVGEKIGRPLLLPAVRNALDSALSSQGAILASGPQIALLLHFNNKNGRSRLYGG
ncbi:uncharacterized protein LOC120712637 isoform X1 [Panicum virgatum]|uniref:Uncharacterized protein n=1 Tax=Panicum virgatum TaxID=38727 RepID=A0A8T0RI94_PANVG|nr:uncharacterized protein LOC120712637 isoform X1 [Panicum virgatum]KAG2584513.1 hypothetical protein PVAP13_6KG309500 [Panicum virgatum]